MTANVDAKSGRDPAENSIEPSDASADPSASSATPKKKKLKRVRKDRNKSEDESVPSDPAAALAVANLGANTWTVLTSSRFYFLLLLLRFFLMFITTASLEGTEFSDGVDVLASTLLPGMSVGGVDPQLNIPPIGLGDTNQTRSIVGAFITSGLPYMGVNLACTRLFSSCSPSWIGYLALYVPRIWMFMLTLIADVLLVRCFAVYEGENALPALLTYASTWTTLLAVPRNVNFSLESLCVIALVAACFGWPVNTARPLFWLSSIALSLGVFLRPPFAFFIFTPVIYLSSLWGKSGLHPLRYVRASMEGLAIFVLCVTTFVTIDSVYFGTFKLKFDGVIMTSFEQFVEHAMNGETFSYQGKLIYTPLNALKTVASRKVLSQIATNTSPGQMFLSLPSILGPLFIVLIRESYAGMKVAMKDLMSELKQAANSKKPKKRKPKKAGMTKEREDELYVYFDTIQTTFLLGLLIEVVQNHDRLGVLSLLSLMPPCIVCIAGTIFGPESSVRFRAVHIAFTVAMVLFFGLFNQAGVPRLLLRAGSGAVKSIPAGAALVVYRGIIGHRSLLGPNVANVSVHDGGDSRLKLMTKIRELRENWRDDQILVLASSTVRMKEGEFVAVESAANGHMSALDLPANIDDAVRRSTLNMYRFVGDEDEAIIRDDEEAAEKEEREREEKAEKKRKSREQDKVEL